MAGVMVMGATIAFCPPAPVRATEGNAYDPDTGLLCLTPACDYVRSPKDKNSICRKVWPNNDRRKKVELDCKKKSGGRWVAG